jgi:gliding motility-associated-like protein
MHYYMPPFRNNNFKKLIFSLLTAIVLSVPLQAQIDNIFWFAAPEISPNHAHNPITFCFTSFSSPATVTISQPANPAFTPVTVNLNAYSYYALDVTNQESTVSTAPVNTVCNYGFKIVSTSNITTYYQLGANNSEIYTLKGRNALGTDFTIPMQNLLVDGPPSDPRNSIEIVATENNTTVTIIPSQPLTGGIAAGTPITITLNAGQSYCIKSADQSAAGHLTNTRITSDKPIAVNSTDDSVASNQFSGYSGQDLVGEQLVPDEYAGDFFIAMYNNRQFENINIIPIQNNTHVYINGSSTPSATLNQGQSYTYMPSNSPTIATMITSDKPIHVFQLTGSDGEAGGTQLPALGCTGSMEVVYARPSYSTHLRLSIVVPTQYVNGFTMTVGNNNVPVPASYFTVLPYNPAWSYCYRDFASSVPTQQVMILQNSLGPFHLGILDYYTGMSSSLGYFSNYSSVGRIDLYMENLYCLHDSVPFIYLTENIDTVHLVTPSGDTLTQEPFVISDLTLADTGWYYVLAHSEIGCEETWVNDSINIQLVNSYKPDLGPDQYLCTGEVAVLHANYAANGVEYNWSTGDTGDSIEVITSGEYILNVALDNPNATFTCESSDTVLVSFYPLPHADLEADITTGCTPLSIHFTDISSPSVDSLTTEWIIFDENNNVVDYSNEDNPSVEIVDAGTYSVKLVITTPEGCKDSIIKWNYITTSAQPTIDFIASPEISMMSDNGGNVDFTAFLSDNVAGNPTNNLVWHFGDGETEEGPETTVSHVYTSWGDYTVSLTLETGGGCGDSVSHIVVLEDDLIFPNVITPNGDGINDVWAIGNLNTSINPEDPDNYRHNELRISDRYGKVVFHVKNYDTWSKDGEIHEGLNPFNGEGLSDGVYYFVFTYKGKAKSFQWNGSITIIR